MTENQAYIIIVIALVSAAIACWSIFVSRKIARQKATLEFISEYNGGYIAARAREFIRTQSSKGYRYKGDASAPWADLNSHDRRYFLCLMSNFETLSVGLNNGIYDKKLVIDVFGTELINLYDKSSEVITYVRKQEADPEAFSEFQKLADSLRYLHYPKR